MVHPLPEPRPAGKKVREHVGRFQVAVEALVKRRQEIREARWIAPGSELRSTFSELVKQMIADKEGRCRQKTMRMNRSMLKRIEEQTIDGKAGKFGEMSVAAISTVKVNELLRALRTPSLRETPYGKLKKKVELSGPSLNNYRIFLGSVFRYGIENGFTSKNPAKATKKFSPHPGIIRYLTADEETAIRNVMREWNPEMEAEMDLALNTGLRSGEMFHLTWDLVDLDRGILTVPDEGKTGRRFVPINSAARAALLTLHEQSRGSASVCYRTESPNDIRSLRFRRITRRAGVLKFRWHDLRHTFASRLVMAGVDLRTVQQFLGHASILMTMRYAHLAPEHGKAAIEKLCPQQAPAAGTLELRKTG